MALGKKTQKFTLVVLTPVLILGIIAAVVVPFNFSKNPPYIFKEEAKASCGNPPLSNSGGSCWSYYRPVTITGSTAGAQTNYQVNVQLTTAVMGNPYTNVKTDGSDIRFTNASGTELSYWIESWSNTGASSIWVKVDSIPASPSTATIYMYYGNSSATSSSNGSNTFIFFDDFYDLTQWTKYTGGTSDATVSGGILSMYRDGVNELQIVANATLPSRFISETRVQPVNNNVVKHWFGWNSQAYTTNVDFAVERNGWQSGQRFISGYGLGYTYVGAPLYNWQVNKIIVDTTGATVTYGWYQDGALVGNYATNKGSADTTNQILIQATGGGSNGSGYFYVDWVRVRSYASPEPTNSVGSQITVQAAPSQVTGVTATAGNAQIILNWTAPNNNGSAITSYNVYRSTTSGGETLLVSGSCSGLGNVLTCTDTGLNNGTTYYYQVSAANGVGEGQKSAEVSAMPSVPPNVYGWAWSENIGWISFNCTNTSCISSNYGVNLDLGGTNNLSGYAWSENIGWISFNPADWGALCPAGTCQPRLVGSDFFGWARALANGSGWDGWISLNCANSGVCATSNYKVSLSGTNFSGFAWGSDVVGWLEFNPILGGVYIVNTPPSAISLAVSQPDYCSSGPSAILSWTFSDPDIGDSQTAYQVQIATDAGFTVIIKDTGKLLSSSSSYATPAGTLVYNQAYYWRVKVWDNYDAPSSFATGPSFSTPVHAYPTASFTYTPANPMVGQVITFSDTSTAFGGATIVSRNWDFCNGTTCPNQFSSGTPVTHTYTTKNNYTVQLTVKDSDNFSCSTTKVLNLTKSILSPGWKEVVPK